MTLKVLRNKFFFNTRLRKNVENQYVEIEPIFNREGSYLDGDKCWFEVDGKAYVGDKEQFLYDLQILHDAEKGIDVYRALKALMRIDKSVLTKEQIRFCSNYEDVLEVEKLKRDIRRMMKEVKQ